MMGTLNKDGSPRKAGSGRPKGSKSFINVSLKELQNFVGENALIPVRKVWLHEVAIQLMDRVDLKEPSLKR
jgi:hypothetical protein